MLRIKNLVTGKGSVFTRESHNSRPGGDSDFEGHLFRPVKGEPLNTILNSDNKKVIVEIGNFLKTQFRKRK